MADSHGDARAHSDEHDDSEDERLALSPADGYFGASSLAQTLSPGHAMGSGEADSRQVQQSDHRHRQSANVPRVPNVLVEDPTLGDGPSAAKAREAAEERRMNSSQPETPQPETAPPASAGQDAHSQPPASSPNPSPAASPISPRMGHSRDPPWSPASETAQVEDASPAQTAPVTTTTCPRRRQAASASEATPLILPHQRRELYTDAPPAYSPPASTPYQTFTPRPATNPTSPQEGSSFSETQPLLSTSTHVQSMPSPHPASDMVDSFAWRRFAWSRSRYKLSKRTVLGLAALIIAITVAVATIGLFLLSRKQKHDFVEEPVGPPDDGDGEMRWAPLDNCRKTTSSHISGRTAYSFNGSRKLTILQAAFDEQVPRGRRVQVFGDIVVRPQSGTYFSSGSFLVESIANADNLGFNLDWSEETDTFKIKTMQSVAWPYGDSEPCLQLRIVLFVPPDTLVRALDIQAQSLDVKIHEGLTMSVAEGVDILTMTGDVVTPQKDSAKDTVPYRLESSLMTVETVAGEIRGWLPLYDQLLLQSQTGNISTTVSRKQSKSDPTKPSQLWLSSTSGHINVEDSMGQGSSSDSMPREHKVDISTESGSVTARTLYSSAATFSSNSGNMNLVFWPAAGADCLRWTGKGCLLDTETTSGTTNLIVTQPSHSNSSVGRGSTANGQRAHLSHLASLHTSRGGNVNAVYPNSWQGDVLAATISGQMIYRGRDLVMKPWDAVTRRMKGKKGDGSALMIVNTSSGDHHVLIGDDEPATEE